MTSFRVATFVNDDDQYREMRASFEGSGFVPPIARFTVEAGEPYAGITRLGQAEEPYVLLVHQDVRCDRGDTAESLHSRLAELTERDPQWVVAGNAGRRSRSAIDEHPLIPVRNISDPHGTTWSLDLPARVISLDENLLILRTAARPTCSSGLAGWHLYGTDVALNATLSGHSAYVVDFRVTHLSGGNRDGFPDACRRFAEHWRSRPEAQGLQDPSTPLACVLSVLKRFEADDKAR